MVHDIFIIGGGINGCGVARDAAGRGYSVFLAEMDDLASGTSCASTKLIHGGLRYLEHYEFRLVRESLMEREVLWANAPHIIRPMRFVLPLHKAMRPAWLLRLGLFLYDHIGGRKLLPKTATLDLTRDSAGRPLKPSFTKAFEYSDCWVDDTRLVVLNARDAADRGAVIRTRCKVMGAQREGELWTVRIEDRRSGKTETVQARLLVNAAGPWVDHVLALTSGGRPVHNIRLVQGSHIVVRRKFDDPRAYFFQNRDGRIAFAIPYEEDFTLIGTTDQDYHGSLERIVISQGEIDYLCALAGEYFTEPIRPEDIVWTYSGVRPLFDDGATKAQEATRDYVLTTQGGPGSAGLINIFGGKITTYRKLSEAVLEKAAGFVGDRGKPWTRAAPLPGGQFPVTGFAAELDKLRSGYPFLEPDHARRLLRHYGTTGARAILGLARSRSDLGRCFGADLCEAEIRHLILNEWAQTAEDVLWRRTKCGLRLSLEEAEALGQYMNGAAGDIANAAAE